MRGLWVLLAAGVADAAPLLVTIGNLTEQKDHANLVAACGRLRDRFPDLRAVILGEVGVNFGAGMTGGFAFVLDLYNDFVDHYNHRRVHESLGNVTPAADLAVWRKSGSSAPREAAWDGGAFGANKDPLLTGLTVPPQVRDPAEARPYFDKLAKKKGREITEQDAAIYSLCRPERLLVRR